MNALQEQQKVELPVVLQTERTASQCIGLPLCVILTEPKLLPWYYEQFVEIFLFNGAFQYMGMDFQFLGYNFDIFQYYRMNLDKSQKETIVDYIKERMTEAYYAYINVDIFYIPQTSKYMKEHLYHDMLLYGYDDKRQCFLAVLFNQEEKLAKVEIRFEDIRKAACHIPDNPDNFYDVTVFKLHNYSRPYPFDLNRFLLSLNRYLQSEDRTADAFFTRYIRMESHYRYDFGIQGERKLLEGLLDSDKNHFREMHFMWEHKQGLIQRFSYIVSQYPYCEGIQEEVAELERITEQFALVRMLYIRAEAMETFGSGKQALLSSVCSRLKTAIDREEACLFRLYEALVAAKAEEEHRIYVKNITKSASCSTETDIPSYSNSDISKDWFFRRYSHHDAVVYRWPEKRAIHTVVVRSDRCTIITCSDGRQMMYPSAVSGTGHQHIYRLEVPVFFDWIRVDSFAHVPMESHSPVDIYEADLTFRQTYTASSTWPNLLEESFDPEQAFDYRQDTHWNAAGMSSTGEYLEVHFSKTVILNYIILRQRNNGDRICAYSVLCRKDEHPWREVYTYDGKTIGYEEKHHHIPETDADCLRIWIRKTVPDVDGYIEPGIASLRVYHMGDR